MTSIHPALRRSLVPSGLLAGILFAASPAVLADSIQDRFTLTGLGSTCAAAHVRNRMALAERARLACVNRAGQVRVVNMVNQNYRTLSCTREGLRKHTAFGEFTYDCR